MVIQSAEFEGNDIVYIWLSKKEKEDPVLIGVIDEIKKKYRVCTFFSGTLPTTDYIRKMVFDNL